MVVSEIFVNNIPFTASLLLPMKESAIEKEWKGRLREER